MRLLVAVLLFVCGITLAACGGTVQTSTTTATSQVETSTTEGPSSLPTTMDTGATTTTTAIKGETTTTAVPGESSTTESPSSLPMDTGVTTTTLNPPASVPAHGSGITSEQVKQLLASYAGFKESEIEVTDYATFEDWAAAKVKTRLGASGVVFVKVDGFWFLRDNGVDSAVALSNIGAPAEVRSFFGF